LFSRTTHFCHDTPIDGNGTPLLLFNLFFPPGGWGPPKSAATFASPPQNCKSFRLLSVTCFLLSVRLYPPFCKFLVKLFCPAYRIPILFFLLAYPSPEIFTKRRFFVFPGVFLWKILVPSHPVIHFPRRGLVHAPHRCSPVNFFS